MEALIILFTSYLIAALILWFGSALLVAMVASSKGRSTFGWFLLGLIFSLFALITVAVLPSLKRPRYASRDLHPTTVPPEQISPAQEKTCPECAETVKERARICRFCGYEFREQKEEVVEDEKQLEPKATPMEARPIKGEPKALEVLSIKHRRRTKRRRALVFSCAAIVAALSAAVMALVIYPESSRDFISNHSSNLTTLFEKVGTQSLIIRTNANVRSGPGKEHPVIASLREGTAIAPGKSEGDWVFFQRDLTSGWVHRSLLKPIDSSYRWSNTVTECEYKGIRAFAQIVICPPNSSETTMAAAASKACLQSGRKACNIWIWDNPANAPSPGKGVLAEKEWRSVTAFWRDDGTNQLLVCAKGECE